MTKKEALHTYLLQLADNALILGHRLSEWCGHGPVLEQDMAMTNIALDLVGQARSLFQYAAEAEGKGKTEDDLAYLRTVTEYRNVLLVEQPNEDFAYTVARQFLYDIYSVHFYTQLKKSSDKQLAAIAEKSLKEVTYHVRWSSEWMIRLGDGTDISHQKIQKALNDLWPYSGELLQMSEAEEALLTDGISVDLSTLKKDCDQKIKDVLAQATLTHPEDVFMQTGGKKGLHSEHFGFILSELQYLQRAYPGQEW